MECLAALIGQSQHLDIIYIIDNASTDGTPDLLRERQFMNHPRISYHRMPTNGGGAGGFRSGLEIAYQNGHDWFWIMDDDAIAKTDALAQMIPHLNYGEICALANLKIDSVGEVQHFHLGKATTWNPLARDLINPIRPADYENKDHVEIEFSSFVGLLVNRYAVEQIGFPNQDFFIHYDDYEYCLRMRQVGKIVLVPKSVIIHKSSHLVQSRKRFLFLSGVSHSLRAHCFHYFSYRNRTWIVKQYVGLGLLGTTVWAAVHFARQVLKATLFERDHYCTRVYVLFRAHLDGLSNRFDNSFPMQVMNGKMS